MSARSSWGDDGGLEADDPPRPRVATLAERGQQIVADLVAHTALHMAAGTQFTQGAGVKDGGFRSTENHGW